MPQTGEAPNTVPAIALPAIRLDGGTQPRAAIHRDWIEEYAFDMAFGAEFPPVVVFFDGDVYWLADGFHRYHAAAANGWENIPADVRHGTRGDAVLFSVGANAAHGQRRNNEDKRSSVLTLLKDAEWQGKSDTEIAKLCAVSHELVRTLRPKPIPQNLRDSQIRTVTRGKPFEMNVGNIGRTPTAPASAPVKAVKDAATKNTGKTIAESLDIDNLPAQIRHAVVNGSIPEERKTDKRRDALQAALDLSDWIYEHANRDEIPKLIDLLKLARDADIVEYLTSKLKADDVDMPPSHPALQQGPEMRCSQFDELLDDIEENGPVEPHHHDQRHDPGWTDAL